MNVRNHEYDRFGPWAIEISDEDPPPPLFVPCLTRAEPTLLSIKIPRRIERRSAQPGMDLYDYLVCLYEDDLQILQRVGHEVRAETFRYRDVQHLRVTQDLLRGNVHLGLPGRACDLPYNTVADKLMLRAVDLIRQRYGGQDGQQQGQQPGQRYGGQDGQQQGQQPGQRYGGPDGQQPGRAPLGTELEVREAELSFYFERLLASERQQRTGMRLLAAQGSVAVGSRGMSAARRAIFRIASKRLLETMHLSDGRELKIIGRGQAYAYRWQAVYGIDTWHIPVANLRGVSWQDDAEHGATNLILQTSGGSSVHVFRLDNPSIEPYAAFLSSLLGGAQQTTASPSHPRPA